MSSCESIVMEMKKSVEYAELVFYNHGVVNKLYTCPDIVK